MLGAIPSVVIIHQEILLAPGVNAWGYSQIQLEVQVPGPVRNTGYTGPCHLSWRALDLIISDACQPLRVANGPLALLAYPHLHLLHLYSLPYCYLEFWLPQLSRAVLLFPCAERVNQDSPREMGQGWVRGSAHLKLETLPLCYPGC